MAVSSIPPQAYTKETLLKAYAWLMNQDQHVKELATTPDILVSLFLKAQRKGDESVDAPSIQSFKNELKNLAGMMGELDSKTQSQTVIVSHSTQTTQKAQAAGRIQNGFIPRAQPVDAVASKIRTEQSRANSVKTDDFIRNERIKEEPLQNDFDFEDDHNTSSDFVGYEYEEPQAPIANQKKGRTFSARPQENSRSSVKAAAVATGKPSDDLDLAKLDPKTMNLIQEIRLQLNLSTDQEALRMMVVVAHAKLKTLL